MKAFKKEIYRQCDLMAIKKSNVACVHRRNITQYDSGERCGPWASCFQHVLNGRYLLCVINSSHTPLERISSNSAQLLMCVWLFEVLGHFSKNLHVVEHCHFFQHVLNRRYLLCVIPVIVQNKVYYNHVPWVLDGLQQKIIKCIYGLGKIFRYRSVDSCERCGPFSVQVV